MANITCYRCFARFHSRGLHFKCNWHAGDDPRLGNVPYSVFPWRPATWQINPPAYATCPKCQRFTTFRVCRSCANELPHYAGRVTQRIIAVTGCMGSGKTLYHWALLHQLRERLGGQSETPAVVMFEDDESFRTFRKMDHIIRGRGELPQFTHKEQQIQGEWHPIIVRLYKKRRTRGQVHNNLIFYDHAGELVHALRDVKYLRYLAHASGLIYLVDPLGEPEMAREGLNAVIHGVRAELKVAGHGQLALPLAIAIAKSDAALFAPTGGGVAPVDVLPDAGSGLSFWNEARPSQDARIARTSRKCEEFLNVERGLHSFTSLAANSFQSVRYFAISSLNGARSSQNRLLRIPEPLGVEHPLFWLMSQLD